MVGSSSLMMSAKTGGCVRSRDERHGRHDHLVAWSYIERHVGEVQRRRAARHRDRVFRAMQVCKSLLELLGPRSHRQPARPHHLGNSLDLVRADVDV
jgi:hypothetical protein